MVQVRPDSHLLHLVLTRHLRVRADNDEVQGETSCDLPCHRPWLCRRWLPSLNRRRPGCRWGHTKLLLILSLSLLFHLSVSVSSVQKENK